jgi:hypothetical protein
MKQKITLKSHLVVSAAQLLPAYPLLSAADRFIVETPPGQSLSARLLSTGITLLGTGTLYDTLREKSLDFCGLEEETSSPIAVGAHDACFNALAYTVGTIPLYLVSGVTEPRQLALAASGTALFGFVSGPVIGATTDILKDWCGIEPCERLPKVIRNRSSWQKWGLAGLLAAGSLSLTAASYLVPTSSKSSTIYNQNP